MLNTYSFHNLVSTTMFTNCLTSSCRSNSELEESIVTTPSYKDAPVVYTQEKYGCLTNFENSMDFQIFVNQLRERLKTIALKANCVNEYEHFESNLLEYLQYPDAIDSTTKQILYHSAVDQLELIDESLNMTNSGRNHYTNEKIRYEIIELFSQSDICLPGLLNNLSSAAHGSYLLSNKNDSIFQYHKEKLIEQIIIKHVENTSSNIPLHNHWVKAFKERLQNTPFHVTEHKQDDIFISNDMKYVAEKRMPSLLFELCRQVNTDTILLSMADEIMEKSKSLKIPGDDDNNLSDESISKIYKFVSNHELKLLPQSVLELDEGENKFRIRPSSFLLAQDLAKSLSDIHSDLSKTKQQIHFKSNGLNNSIYSAGDIWWWEVDGVKKQTNLTLSDLSSLNYHDKLPDGFVNYLLKTFSPEQLRSIWKSEWLNLDSKSKLLFNFIDDGHIVDFLLEHDSGDALFARHNITCNTPIHEAILSYSDDTLDVILKHKNMHVALFALKGGIGQIPLHTAINKLNDYAFIRLLKYPSNKLSLLKMQDADGDTALHYTVMQNQRGMTESLLDRLPKDNDVVSIRNGNGLTILDTAIGDNNAEMAGVIIDSGKFNVRKYLNENTDVLDSLIKKPDIEKLILSWLDENPE